jgi:hypothetical protein
MSNNQKTPNVKSNQNKRARTIKTEEKTKSKKQKVNQKLDPKDKKIKILSEKLKSIELELKKLKQESITVNGKKCHFCEKILKRNMNIYSEPKKNRLMCMKCAKKLF